MRALALMLVPSLVAAAPCEQRGAKPTDARLVDEGHVVACFTSCWSFDLATRAWSPTGPLPPAAEPAPAPDEPPSPATFSTTLRPCKQCKELVATGVPPFGQARVDYNEDRSLVAVQASFSAVSIFDAKSEKRLATIRAWKTGMGDVFRSYVLTGDRVIVFVADTPVTSAGRIFDARTGKRVANVGDGDGTQIDEDAVAVGRPEVRMFSQFDSGVRWIQDLRTGRVIQRIDFGKADVGFEAQARGAVVGFRGDVVVYDIAANKQTRYPVPTCK